MPSKNRPTIIDLCRGDAFFLRVWGVVGVHFREIAGGGVLRLHALPDPDVVCLFLYFSLFSLSLSLERERDMYKQKLVLTRIP